MAGVVTAAWPTQGASVFTEVSLALAPDVSLSITAPCGLDLSIVAISDSLHPAMHKASPMQKQHPPQSCACDILPFLQGCLHPR